jgi:hypothetical protein
MEGGLAVQANNPDYDNAFWLTWFPTVESPVKHVFQDILADFPGKRTGTLKIILANLYMALQYEAATGNETFIRIRLRKDWYIGKSKNFSKHCSYTQVHRTLNFLESHGFLTVAKGFWDKETQSGRVTRLRASEKLQRFFINHAKDFTLSLITESPVLINDGNGNYLAPDDTQTHQVLCHIVEEINRKQRFFNTYIDISSIPLNYLISLCSIEKEEGEGEGSSPSCTGSKILVDLINHRNHGKIENEVELKNSLRLTRLFRDNLHTHGRFYCDVQNLPKNMREHIVVDGESVVELDYSGMHGRCLYAELHIDYRDDPYDVPGLSRTVGKKAYFCCINSGSWQGAIEAIAKAQREGLDLNGMTPRRVVKAFEKKHKPIVEFFYRKDNWGRLQFLDSQIAERVIMDFVRAGEWILPIHDSFVVRRGMEDFLRDSMIRHYTGLVGFPPIIDKKY